MSAPSPPRPSTATRDLSALRIDRSEEPGGSRRRLLPGWLVVVVVLIGAAAVATPIVLKLLPAFATEVTTAPAILERPSSGASVVLASSGYVVARRKASVSSQTAGILERLDVEEGSIVEEGQLNARIQNDALEADVRAASATAGQAEAARSRATADVELARLDLARQERLSEAGLGSRADLDTARATAASREAAAREAAAFVESSRARAAEARVHLANADVLAPFSGVVLKKEAEVGEYVAPSVGSGSLTRGAIVTMADLASLEVESDVAEGNVARLIDGMPAEIALDAVPDRRYRGRLRQVMPMAERSKATVQVKVSLLDPDARVKPEMSAKVQFLSAEPDADALVAPPVVTAPVAAIVVAEGAGAVAFVVQDDRVRRVAVTLGERRGDRVVVASGLLGGESLVLSPPPDLEDGAKVKLRG